MTHYWNCRLTLIGSRQAVSAFTKSAAWAKAMGAKHVEWLQLSPTRHVCEFETAIGLPAAHLQKLSRRWPRLTLLLDYEVEKHRIKGVAKAKAGKVEHCEIGY